MIYIEASGILSVEVCKVNSQGIKMPQVKIVARNFMDMVASLPAMKLDKLYENSFICEAILRLYY